MERQNVLAGSNIPVREVITFEGIIAGYAFLVRLGNSNYTLTAVSQPYAEYSRTIESNQPEGPKNNPFYVVEDVASLKDPETVIIKLRSLPDDELRRLLVPADPIADALIKKD